MMFNSKKGMREREMDENDEDLERLGYTVYSGSNKNRYNRTQCPLGLIRTGRIVHSVLCV